MGYSLFVFSNCHLSVSKGAFVFGQADASRTLDFGHWRRASIAKHALHDWRASPAQGAAFQFLGSSQSDPGPSPPPMARQHPLAGAAPRLSKKNISIFRGPYMLGTTNIFAER